MPNCKFCGDFGRGCAMCNVPGALQRQFDSVSNAPARRRRTPEAEHPVQSHSHHPHQAQHPQQQQHQAQHEQYPDEDSLNELMGGLRQQAMGDGRGGAPTDRNFTFTNQRVQEITRENMSLLHRLSSIATKESRAVPKPPVVNQPKRSSADINRQKDRDRIARENEALHRRLTGVKPSTNLTRNVREANKKQQEQYLRNCSSRNTDSRASRGVPPANLLRPAASSAPTSVRNRFTQPDDFNTRFDKPKKKTYQVSGLASDGLPDFAF